MDKRLISKKLLSITIMTQSDIMRENIPMVNIFTLRRINHPSKKMMEVIKKSNNRIHPIMIA